MAFDPLDGSSIVDTNFTVGTIFGVWPGDKLTGVTGGDQVAAAMGIYGPRTTYIIALKDAPGTHEFLLLDEGNAYEKCNVCLLQRLSCPDYIIVIDMHCLSQVSGSMSRTHMKLVKERCSLQET